MRPYNVILLALALLVASTNADLAETASTGHLLTAVSSNRRSLRAEPVKNNDGDELLEDGVDDEDEEEERFGLSTITNIKLPWSKAAKKARKIKAEKEAVALKLAQAEQTARADRAQQKLKEWAEYQYTNMLSKKRFWEQR
ncbi:hypothetical protein PHYBOEH_002810 [Phytophthora boehmeriae]|uniref:RxLR effector protein n=1 Tax=Phytophthora boehmeriae TaxID=109152 RepID=A0A8T1WTT0_9STRA|nr:hypothetical protein PHYBOEH_002810 [Phytophthora boehmeriae]